MLRIMNRPILKLCSLRSNALALVLSACAIVLAACAQNLETGSIPTGVAPQKSEIVAAPLLTPTFALAATSQPLARKSAAPEKNEVFDVIPVFWGTNRKGGASSAESRLRFAADRSDELQTGVARVTVPLSKRSPGEIHRPWEVGVLSWTLYSQKEDPRRHFTFTGMERLPLDGFLEAASRYGNRKGRFEDHAFVFVHGYNTDFDSALFRTAQIAHDMGFDGTVYAFSWPSLGKETGYLHDRDSIDFSVPHFTRFLEAIATRTNVKHLHVIAHSMGTRLVFESVYPSQGNSALSRLPNLKNVILAAADLDTSVLEQRSKGAVQPPFAITLYASSRDRALMLSKKFARGVPRAGDVPDGIPVVVPGIDTIDISASTTWVFLGAYHNTYAEKSHVLGDMALLMKTGVRPPDLRSPTYRTVKGSQGVFWRYVSN
jgi:esterase/lipase superfamily enzyme